MNSLFEIDQCLVVPSVVGKHYVGIAVPGATLVASVGLSVESPSAQLEYYARRDSPIPLPEDTPLTPELIRLVLVAAAGKATADNLNILTQVQELGRLNPTYTVIPNVPSGGREATCLLQVNADVADLSLPQISTLLFQAFYIATGYTSSADTSSVNLLPGGF
jgi:hypothetical protein